MNVVENLGNNRDFFKKHGIKHTKQRELIFEILKNSNKPLSAEEVFLKSKEVDDSISLSTIYRVLNTFIDKDIVVKLSIVEDNISMFELNRVDHGHHLLCIKCKKTVDIGHCPLGVYENSLEETTDFDIVGHKLEIYGYCPECKKKK